MTIDRRAVVSLDEQRLSGVRVRYDELFLTSVMTKGMTLPYNISISL